MSQLPTWLTTLQRVREARRDLAWQSLAQCLRAADVTHSATAEINDSIARLQQTQKQASLPGQIDAERLQQLSLDRQARRSQLAEAQQRQQQADRDVQQAQVEATSNEAEVEVLRRLSDRLETAIRSQRQRQQEHSALAGAFDFATDASATTLPHHFSRTTNSVR